MMTEKAKAIINRKLEDLNDDIHDLFVCMHDEQHIQILPTDYIDYVRKVFMMNLLHTAQDLTDEFNEEIDE